MDRSERQARHSRLPLRSWKVGLKENGGLYGYQFEIDSGESATIRIVRKLDPFRHATLLRSTGATKSRNAGRPIEQHCRHLQSRSQAILESKEPHARCQYAGYSTLSRDTRSNIRKYLVVTTLVSYPHGALYILQLKG